MKLPVPEPVLLHLCSGEQIDVLRIRLRNARQATAVLSDFFSAERVLTEWARSGSCSIVRFEVAFADGYVLSGSYEFARKGKRKCTFSTHIRRMMNCEIGTEGYSQLHPAHEASRYMIPAY